MGFLNRQIQRRGMKTRMANGFRKGWRKFREEVLQLNFYRVHMAYFIATILIASVIVYGSGLADDPKQAYGGHLEYVDALFLCTSAMTATGKFDESPETMGLAIPGARLTTRRRAGNGKSQYFDSLSTGRSCYFDHPRERRLRQHICRCHSSLFLQEEASPHR